MLLLELTIVRSWMILNAVCGAPCLMLIKLRGRYSRPMKIDTVEAYCKWMKCLEQRKIQGISKEMFEKMTVYWK